MLSGKRIHDDERSTSDSPSNSPRAEVDIQGSTSPRKRQNSDSGSAGYSSPRKRHKVDEKPQIAKSSINAPEVLKKPAPRARKKRFQFEGSYCDDYRLLLNEDIRDARRPEVSQDPGASKLRISQLGGSTWTARDKETFFHAVARYGRDFIRVAVAVGKSVSETTSYALLLDGEATTRSKFIGSLDQKHMPAAVEISKACEEALELSGDALAWRQFRWEMEEEREKHGETWLLTTKNAEACTEDRDLATVTSDDEEATQDSAASDDEDSESSSSSPTNEFEDNSEPVGPFELLDLPNLLELSSTVFMNSTSPHLNWTTQKDVFPLPPTLHSKALTGPAIFKTAFGDLHQLVLNYTKRLVATAQYQAQSRLRANDNDMTKSPDVFVTVEECDVRAAIDILGFKHDGEEFWIQLPRRFVFDWFFDNSTTKKLFELTRGMAEECLRDWRQIKVFTAAGAQDDGGAIGGQVMQGDDGLGNADERAEESEVSEGSEQSEESDASISHVDEGQLEAERIATGGAIPEDLDDVPDTEEEDSSGAVNAQLETADHENDLAQERMLWNMLGKPAPLP